MIKAMNRQITTLLVLLLVLLATAIVGCAAARPVGTVALSATEMPESRESEVITTWKDAMPENIPEPLGVKRYVLAGTMLNQTFVGKGSIQCQGLNEVDLNAYKVKLIDCGFRVIDNNDGNSQYINDHYILYILDQSFLEIDSYILLSFEKIKSSASLLLGERTTDEAKVKIQAFIDGITDTNHLLFQKQVGELVQLDYPDVWEKTQTQVFKDFSLGEFLICSDQVSYFLAGRSAGFRRGGGLQVRTGKPDRLGLRHLPV